MTIAQRVVICLGMLASVLCVCDLVYELPTHWASTLAKGVLALVLTVGLALVVSPRRRP